MENNNTIDMQNEVIKLQVIYTTAEDGQFVANVPMNIINMSYRKTCLLGLNALFFGRFCFLPDSWKEDCLKGATQTGCHIPDDLNKVPELVKISMCITIPKGMDYKTPKWYDACNGKIYFNQE